MKYLAALIGVFLCSSVSFATTLPPARPSNLTATAVSSSQINLSWTDNSKNEITFKIERSRDGTTFRQINAVGVNVTAYTDSGRQASTRYYYRVRAYNLSGNSGYSNTANATTLVQLQVYIAVRTDGLPGSGTQADPYDGSTAAKFDALLRSIPAYTTIHLGSGTFLTTGSASYNGTQGYIVKPGWKIMGAGKDLTTVKAIYYPAAAGPIGHHVFEGDCNVDGNGTVISDLTVDCNWQNLGAATGTKTAAINLFGNNCRISRVRAINAYGNWASLAECFCISISPVHSMNATGAVIEDCDVSNFQGDYGYAICLPSYDPLKDEWFGCQQPSDRMDRHSGICAGWL
jgi:hypothetical protein